MKERKVVYVIYNKEDDAFELYINTQKYNKYYECWELVDEVKSNLVCAYPCQFKENDRDPEKRFIHYGIVTNINNLVYRYNYTFIGGIR